MNFRNIRSYIPILFSLILTFVSTHRVQAQTGNIEGRVVSAETQEPLANVNVGLMGTSQGAATGDDGRFTIKNVSVGSYELSVSFVGYKNVRRDIRVRSDQTTRLNIQLSQTSAALSEVVVVDTRGYEVDLANIATRLPMPVMRIPQSIQAVPREVINDQKAQDLHEVVRNVSGVFIDNSFGGIGHDFTIRGFNQDFKLRNGFPEDGGTAARRMQDLANVERVEILKGPASIISGRLAPGGVINIVTKKPTTVPMYWFDLEGGTPTGGGGSIQPSIDFSGPLTEDGKIKYRLNALYSYRDGFRKPFKQEYERIFVAPVFSFELGSNTDLLLEAEYTDDKRPFDRGIIYFDGQFSDRSRNLQSESVVSEVASVIGSYTLDHRFTNNLKLRHRSQFSNMNQFNLENVPFAPASNFPNLFPNAVRGDFARYIGSNDRTLRNYSTQTQLNANLAGPLAKHELLFAFDYSRNEFEGVFQSSDPSFAFPEFNGVKNKINIFNPNDQVPAPTRGDLTFVSNDLDNVTNEFGLLLQDQINLSDQWEVLLGGRLSWVSQKTADEVADTEDTREYNAIFSPRAGILYNPIDPVSLYTSFSQSFEPNSARDRDGNLLDPTEGEQFEFGVKSEFLDSRLRTTLASFQITKTNIPRSVNLPGGESYSVPTGEQRSRGIELDVTGQISKGWSVIGSYAFINTEITKADNNEGNELSGVPTHSTSLWSNYQFQTSTLRGLRLGAGVFYRGERQANLANNFQFPSFTRVDARIGYQRNNWEMGLSLKNIFDTSNNYEAIDFGSLVKPGIPLTAVASFSVTL